MPHFSDSIGNSFELVKPPERIISVVPSQTELLFHLGLDEQVLGITKFCIKPERWWQNKQRVGGTKQLDLDKIRSLQPDLILANKEENDRSDIETLALEFNVWTSDVATIEDALIMIEHIGALTKKQPKAKELAEDIRHKRVQFLSQPLPCSGQSAAYLIWREPYMSVGKDTFIAAMLRECGLKNVFEDKGRYPETNLEELQNLAPDLVLLSSEPYPFKEKHRNELAGLLPNSRIMLVDGEMFSWYGSRMQYAFNYFKETLVKAQH